MFGSLARSKRAAFFVVVLLGIQASLGVCAEPDESERGLLERLEQLEKRIARLEAENKELKEVPGSEKRDRPPNRESPTSGPTHEGVVVGSDQKMGGSWLNGLQMESADEAFRISVGGRVHVDTGWWRAPEDVRFGAGGVGPLDDGASFRRARLRTNGTLYETLDFTAEYGFENRAPQFFDVWGELTHLPYLGSVRLGHFREPFSMDALTSGSHLPFLERSLIQDSFVPFRNVGVMAANALRNERLTWALGVFRSVSDAFGIDSGDGDYAVTGRTTINPWYAQDGQGALHFGAACSYRNVPDLVLNEGRGGVRFSSRPGIRISSPLFADTGVVTADSEQLVGLETALALGPLLLQAEYVVAHLEGVDLPTGRRAATFQGGYVQASWFLTGEVRPYLRCRGVFGAAQPHENFFWVESGEDGGSLLRRGAWEVGVRYSFLDLDSPGISGGRLDEVTLGVNWYINPQSRFVVNYLLIGRAAAGQGSDGLTQGLGVRFQVEF